MDPLKKREELEMFARSLKEKSVDELKKLEQEIIKEAEDNDVKTTKAMIKLPKDNYKEVAAGIQRLLDKETIEWRFTLGLVSMYEFWNPDEFHKEIPYPMLDGTLRTLGGLQFTGYEEWATVVAINKYFEPVREEYSNITEKTFDIAAKHNAVMDELKLREPVDDTIPEAVSSK